jgi:hypothetical protein
VGGIDFHIVTTPGLDAIARVRGRDYQADNGRTRLTRRPLTLTEGELLLRHARHMRGLCDEHGVPAYELESEQARRALPRLSESKIADLYDACRGGRIQSTLDVLTVYSRLPQRDRKALLNAMRDAKSMAYFPFDAPDAEGVYSTALPDLLEVMAYIAEEGQWEL